MSEIDNREADLDRVKEACSRLGEHFDTVQIFCTKNAYEEGTVSMGWGEGNWFARYGQVSMWVKKEEGRDVDSAIREGRDD